MLKHELVTNGFEKTIVYEKDGFRVNLSKLPSAGNDDPECICIAKYKDGQDEPVLEVKLDQEEQVLLQELFTL